MGRFTVNFKFHYGKIHIEALGMLVKLWLSLNSTMVRFIF